MPVPLRGQNRCPSMRPRKATSEILVYLIECLFKLATAPAAAAPASTRSRGAVILSTGKQKQPSDRAVSWPGKNALGNWVLACCLAFAVLTAIVPFARSFYRVELNYNEGWNVYNAATVAAHGQLYPQKTGWTTVNYPMLSFVLVAKLHRWTRDYLFTASALSLLSLCSCCLLVGAIVRRLVSTWRPALLAAFFCLAIFAVAADYPAYVGVDDPQMLALLFFLSGFFAYLRLGQTRLGLALSALLFVLAASIKQNPIEFPLAVLLDLLLISRRRALWFFAWGIALLAISLGLQLHYGGPYLFAALLSPRAYSAFKAFKLSGIVLGPLILPLGVSIYTGWELRKDPQRRIFAILLVLAVLAGGYFLGGDGVSINSLFGAYLAMSILAGLFFSRLEDRPHPWAASAPAFLFGWLLIPWLVVPTLDDRSTAQIDWDPPLALERIATAQARFDSEVAFLRVEPGPALCESMLRCYFAGKPYVYDPFNATRMVGLGKLDANVLAAALRRHQYGAIQVNGPLADERRTEMFAPPILAAIRENYHSAFENQDGAIYVPNRGGSPK